MDWGEKSNENSYQNRIIKSYLEKFNTPERFINKILNSFNHPFYIIDVNTYIIKFANNASNLKELNFESKCHSLIHNSSSPCLKCKGNKCPLQIVKQTKKSVVLETFYNNKHFEVHASPIFNKLGEVVEVIKYDLDITKRKIAEQQAVINKSKFDGFSNSTQIGVFQINPEGLYTQTNNFLEKLLSIPKNEIIGKEFISIISPNLSKEQLEFLKQSFIEKKEINFSHPFIDKKGNELFMACHLIPLFENKIFNGFIGTILDLTEYQKAKEKLSQYAPFEPKFKIFRDQKINLTPKEKLCLVGICDNPLFADEELAQNLNLNRSTITAIKNRLKKEQWFRLIYLPNFYALGCNLFSILNYTPITPKNKRREFGLLEEIKSQNSIIFDCETEKTTLSFFFEEKYSEFQNLIDKFSSARQKISNEVTKILFTQELDTVKLFNCAALLDKRFKLDIPKTNKEFIIKKTNFKPKLIAQRILHALIKYPEYSIAELAKKIWISKPTISKIKQKLIENNLIIPLIIPNFRKLEFELFVIVYFKFKEIKTVKEEKNENQKTEPQTVFKIEGRDKVIRGMFFKNNLEYEKEIETLKEFYTQFKNEFELKIIKFPIQEKILSLKINLHSLTEKLLFGNSL